MTRIRAIVTGTVLAAGLALPGWANADVLMWDLFADCAPGAGEVKLKMTYSIADYWVEDDPMTSSRVLYACGGPCDGPRELATPIPWDEATTSCWCMISGQQVPSANDCPADDYAKCAATVRASLPYECDALAHTKICTSPSCGAQDDMVYGPTGVCADLAPPAGADGCLAPLDLAPIQGRLDPGAGDAVGAGSDTSPATLPEGSAEAGGCSLSTRAANASLLSLLLVAAGLSLLLSRRRRR